MKVLIVGLIYNPEYEKDYLLHSSVGISVAHNIYLWNTINGLIDNGVNVDVIGSIPYGNCPNLSDELFVKDELFNINGVNFYQIGFVNFYIVKNITREIKLKRIIKKWISKNKKENKAIVFYDLHKPILKTLKWVEKFDDVKSCLIVPDLTGKLGHGNGLRRLKKVLINISSGKSLDRAAYADSYVFLTQQMNEVVNTNHRPYVLVDGVVDDNKELDIRVPNKRVIMYAGGLFERYGVSYLLSEFEKTDSTNLEMWFCGKGDEEKNIIDASKRDTRIKYFGFINKRELTELERDVCFYINPRINNGEYTKYSFPSKNLEYLLSGKPVIAYKLDGMSDDYDNVFLYLSEEDSLSNMFDKLSNMSVEQIEKIAINGFEFVKRHNGKRTQGEKVFKMLCGLFE